MGESRQAGALAITCIFSILAALFVGARILSRYLGKNFGWDDWLIIVSSFLLLGQTITVYEYILLSRTGYHVAELPKQTIEEQVLALKWSYAVQMFYHPLMGALRASIIMFLFRVKDQRWHIRTALHVVFWVNIGYLISTTIVNTFQCTPVKYTFLRPQMDHEVDADGNVIKHGKCINSLGFIMGSCGLSIFMDLIIIPIPTAMVWNLQMRKKTKLAVVAVMSMGWIATLVSVARLIVYYYRYSLSNTDRSWNIGLVTSIIEPSVGIIAACAPALRRLFTYFMPQYFSDGETPYQTRSATYNGSRQRNVYYDIDKEIDEERADVGREEHEFNMRSLENSKPQKQGTEMAATSTPMRTRSVKTGISEGASEALEAEPEHVLNYKQ